jgi:4-aminobutyrate aminotransferase-like enzyme
MTTTQGTDYEELNERYLVPNANAGPVVVEGAGAEVKDERGRRYLDLEAGPGVVSVGHCHPKVVAAVREQAGKLTQPPGRTHSPLALRLAERLSRLTGGRLTRTFFANSGAEANDGAVKVALKHAVGKGKQGLGILALEHGFHGRLSLPLALTGMAGRKKGLGTYGSFPGVVHAAAPYCYRCPLRLSYPSCGVACAESIEDDLKTRVPGEAAIMVAEPILGVGGIIVPPKEYWPRVEAILRRHDIALVHDEVFTGFGRTGRTFAHEHYGTKPDIITFAKAVGGGVPLGGFIATEEVGAAFEKTDHFTTFGSNNQVGLAAGHAVLDVLREERLPERAEELGGYFLHGLNNLARRHGAIGDVRGKGLMMGVEIVKDRESKSPDPELTKDLQRALRERGVLVSVTGVHGCVLRITPPLVVDRSQIDEALSALEDSFAAVGAAHGKGR